MSNPYQQYQPQPYGAPQQQPYGAPQQQYWQGQHAVPQGPTGGGHPGGGAGPRPVAVTVGAVTEAIMTIPFLVGAGLGVMAILDGLASGDSDAATSGVIFGGLAVVIAGGLALLNIMGVVGVLKRGNPAPAMMATIFLILGVLGAARRSLRFDGGADVPELVAWVLAVVGAVVILVTLNMRSSKTWMAAKNREFIASRQRRR